MRGPRARGTSSIGSLEQVGPRVRGTRVHRARGDGVLRAREHRVPWYRSQLPGDASQETPYFLGFSRAKGGGLGGAGQGGCVRLVVVEASGWAFELEPLRRRWYVDGRGGRPWRPFACEGWRLSIIVIARSTPSGSPAGRVVRGLPASASGSRFALR